MPNPFAPSPVESPREVRLSRRGVLVGAAVLTFVAGTLFSTAALAAGIDSPDMLALIFALGGCTMLLLMMVWYIVQLSRVDARRRAEADSRTRFVERGAPWTQPRRPPSGTTLMWASQVLRRRADIPAPR